MSPCCNLFGYLNLACRRDGIGEAKRVLVKIDSKLHPPTAAARTTRPVHRKRRELRRIRSRLGIRFGLDTQRDLRPFRHGILVLQHHIVLRGKDRIRNLFRDQFD